MSARMELTGVDELRDALRNLPDELTQDATSIVSSHADSAASQIVAKYPERTGNLKNNVVVSHGEKASRWGVGSRIRNTAKHAYIFENGTQARHTAIGANRGSMPPGNVFIPIVMRARRAMVQQLVALVEKAGFTVTGNA